MSRKELTNRALDGVCDLFKGYALSGGGVSAKRQNPGEYDQMVRNYASALCRTANLCATLSTEVLQDAFQGTWGYTFTWTRQFNDCGDFRVKVTAE